MNALLLQLYRKKGQLEGAIALTDYFDRLNDVCRHIYKNWNLVINDHEEFCERGRNYAIPMKYVVGEDSF